MGVLYEERDGLSASERRQHDSMKLPTGFQCQHCYFFNYCVGLFGCVGTNTRCDWAPSRFRINPELVTLKEKQ